MQANLLSTFPSLFKHLFCLAKDYFASSVSLLSSVAILLKRSSVNVSVLSNNHNNLGMKVRSQASSTML